MKKNEPVYQALWADNKDFDQVLISPVMIQDHMPDKLLEALEKLLVNKGPAKPQRKMAKPEHGGSAGGSAHDQGSRDALLLDDSPRSQSSPPHCVVLETSFTDLLPPSEMERQHWDHATTTDLAYQVRALRMMPGTYDISPVGNDGSVATSCSSPTDPPTTASDGLKPHWMTWAPLASPETFSEVSSISSKGSQRRNSGSVEPPPAWAKGSSVCAAANAVQTESDNHVSEPHEPEDSSPQQRVVTKATVEAWPTWFSDVRLAPPVATSPADSTSSLHFEFETFNKPQPHDKSQQLPVDTRQCDKQGRPVLYMGDADQVGDNQERSFTPREPVKHVTFDLFAATMGAPPRRGSWDRQKATDHGGGALPVDENCDEDSGDSMYNSGESFPPPASLEDRLRAAEEGPYPGDESSGAFDAYSYNPTCCHRGSPPPTLQSSEALVGTSDSEEEDEMSSDSGGEATLFNASRLVVTSSPARTKCLTIPQAARHSGRPPPMESSL